LRLTRWWPVVCSRPASVLCCLFCLPDAANVNSMNKITRLKRSNRVKECVLAVWLLCVRVCVCRVCVCECLCACGCMRACVRE
jgi:hypothetical protein